MPTDYLLDADKPFEWEKSNFRHHTSFKINNGYGGTNKTGGIIEVADSLTAKNITSFHAVPSKALCQEVANRHTRECLIINSDTLTDHKSVRSAITHSILHPPNKSVIIAHHSLLNGNYYPVNDFTLISLMKCLSLVIIWSSTRNILNPQ